MIELVLVLALVGFVVWLVTTYIPMPDPFKYAIIVLVVVLLILYVMRMLHVVDIPLR